MTAPVSARHLLQEMFGEMVVGKNVDLLPRYYHPDFLLETNGQRQDYAAFAEGHRKVYATDIAYEVRYDEETWVEAADRVAVRLWIRTQRPNEPPAEFEIVLIAACRDGKIHRMWEITWPDWRQEKAFADY